MRKLTAGLALTAGLLGGAAGTAAIGSGAAAAVTATSAAAVSDRVDDIKDALSGLVSDGTLTQEQADEVAETLDEADLGRGFGHGHGHGPGGFGDPAQLAALLGVTTDELRTALEDGKTLAQVAEAEGVNRTELIDKLVAAADAELKDAVADGRLTEAQAAEIRTDLTARITERVDRAPGDGRGHHGRHLGLSGGGPDDRLIAPSVTLSSSA